MPTSSFPTNQQSAGRGRIPVLRRGRRRHLGQQRDVSTRRAPICNDTLQTQDRVEPPAAISNTHKTPSKKSLNPLAKEFVSQAILIPNVFTPPSATDPGWVDFSQRIPSPTLSRTSTLNPIEEEPDLICDDITDISFDEDRPIERDDYTGRSLDNVNRVYKINELLSFRQHTACESQPAVLLGTFLSLVVPDQTDIQTAVDAMTKPMAALMRGRGGRYVPIKRKWKRPKLSEKSMRPKTIVPTSELESLMKKTRGILNKITPDKFDRLSSRLCELIESKVTCYEHLEVVLEAVVQVAVMQPSFVERYVELLSVLCCQRDFVASWEWAHRAHLDSQKIVKGIVREVCRRLHELYWYLSHPAQHEAFLYELAHMFWGLDIGNDVLDMIGDFCGDKDTELTTKLKDNFFGVEIVMGEMCNQKLMPKGLICQYVINPLLRCQPKDATDGSRPIFWRDQESSAAELEAACKLLTVCGAQLDRSNATRWLDTYLDVICQRAECLDNRLKFMAMDLRDLRSANWSNKRSDEPREERIAQASRSVQNRRYDNIRRDPRSRRRGRSSHRRRY